MPGVPDTDNESHLSIAAKTVKDMIDHFPAAKGPKSDPQLIWNFGPDEVQLRSWETSLDLKGGYIKRHLRLPLLIVT